MIIGTPDTITLEGGRESHGGEGEYSVRTLLDGVPGSAVEYVRDLILYPSSSIGEHLHSGNEEICFVISDTGIMVVDAQERVIGPGSAFLTAQGKYLERCKSTFSIPSRSRLDEPCSLHPVRRLRLPQHSPNLKVFLNYP